jgi:cytochrome c-type protein NapC
MEGVDPGWKVPPELEGNQTPAASVLDRLERIAQSSHGLVWTRDMDTSRPEN